jgi:beta-glucuronidase
MGVFTHQRKQIDLNGTWKFNPDPYQRCRQQQWWKNVGTDASFFPCWNIEGLWDIKVPGTWKTQFPELKWYDGHANYVKDFAAEKLPAGAEAFLCFDGVVYSADIYLNGHWVGRHDWGYSPFQLRVTEYLRQQNRLFVLVDNTLSPDRVPGIRFDWNNDGGIINGVKLIVVPKVHIDNFRTFTRLDGDYARIVVETSLSSRDLTAGDQISVAIPELGLSATRAGRVGEKVSFEFHVPRSAIELWSPESPRLYETIVSTPGETLRDQIGYREIRARGMDVLLNGKPIRLHGVCVHSEFPETGRTATPEGIDKLIAAVKDLGANFVRCAHYPYAEQWGRAMDRAGLLWWEEVPVYWLPRIHEPAMSRLALGMLDDAIRRDWNRASLIIWSVSNECAGDAGHAFDLTGGNYPYWVKACKLVRELDPSRLISSADSGHRRTLHAGWTPAAGDAFANDFGEQQWIAGHPDEFYGLLDVLSGNVYVSGIGHGLTAYHKFVEMLRRYNKPLMISEFGSMSLLGADEMPDVTPTTLGSEARHVCLMREAYQSFRQLPEITGVMPWCITDVRVPMHWRWYNAGKGVFRYGLMDETWRPKKVYAVVKEEIALMRKTMDGLAANHPAPIGEAGADNSGPGNASNGNGSSDHSSTATPTAAPTRPPLVRS